MLKKYKFLQSGESPVNGIGVFVKGEERDIDEDVAAGFVKSGVLKLVATENKKGGK